MPRLGSIKKTLKCSFLFTDSWQLQSCSQIMSEKENKLSDSCKTYFVMPASNKTDLVNGLNWTKKSSILI